MINSANRPVARPRRRRSALTICAATAAAVFAASLAAMAMASATSHTMTIATASDPGLGEQVLVSSQGRTLYALSPETAGHLLCKSSVCLKFWPPLTVASHSTRLRAASGVPGHFGLLRRANGTLQVTYRGLPLYRYSGDHAGGQTNGQGLKSFGGTWHVLSVSSAPAQTSTPSGPAPGTTSPTGPSGAYETPPGGTPATPPTTSTSTTSPPPVTPPQEKHEEPKTKTEPGW